MAIRRVRRVVLACVVVATLIPASAGAHQKSTASPSADAIERAREHAPARALRFTGAPEGTTTVQNGWFPADPFAGTDPRTPAGMLKAAHAAIEHRWGIELPEPAPIERPDALADAGDDALWIGTPAGDLDTDGLEDVLAFEVDLEDFDYATTVHALRGSTGEVLWSSPLGSIFGSIALPGGDLDGDGGDDVLLLSLTVTSGGAGTCVPFAVCAFVDDYTFEWGVAGLSGATGEVGFARAYAGRLSGVYAAEITPAPTIGVAQAFTATNYDVLPLLTEDHDGDGGRDLVINRIDVTAAGAVAGAFPLVTFAFGFGELVLIGSHNEVISGATGLDLFSHSGENSELAFMYPAGDAVGDPASDLLLESLTFTPVAACAFAAVGTCVGGAPVSLTLEMFDGSTLSSAWAREVSVATEGFTYPIEADVNGNGSSDLFLIEFASEGVRQSVLDGSDGSALWALVHDFVLLPIGPTGGGPGSDLFTIEVEFADELSLSFVRIDGATGAELLTTPQTLPEGDYWDVLVFLAGDADGDGVQDPVLDALVFDTNPPVSEVTVESGATGAPIFTRLLNALAFSMPGGDLDGSGTSDLVDWTVEEGLDGYLVSFDGRMMPGGASAWTVTRALEPEFYAFVAPAPNMNGSSGGDLLVNLETYAGGVYQSELSVIDGASGSAGWARPEPLEPPLPKGAISGTIRNTDGDPLGFMCVDVYGDDFSWLGFTYSDPSGAYLARWLPAADARLYVFDCDFGEYASEWYQDKASFEEADIITVTAGVTVSGIDIVLDAA